MSLELQGRRISPGETALKTEWLSILRDVVRPALASAGLSTTVPPVPARVGDRVVADALQIARREVSGMPGTTIEQLVQQWRQSICREIPWPILLAFIKYESGGDFGDAKFSGLLTSLTGKRRRVWFRVGPDGTAEVAGLARTEYPGFEAEFDEIVQAARDKGVF